MTLFSSLNTALTGLQATMAALQTTGHNIANANTPGFSRQRVELQAATPLELPAFQVGRGVEVAGITRVFNQSIQDQLQNSDSTLASLGSQNDTLGQLQGFFNALSGSDLGTQIDTLFKAMQDFSNNPTDISTRQAAISDASTVTTSLNLLNQNVQDAQSQINSDVRATVDDINSIAGQIADINKQIVSTENAGLDSGSANDLRDHRDELLRQLSQDVKITSVTTNNGDVNVLIGSSFLVFGPQSFKVSTATTADNGVLKVSPVFVNGSVPLSMTGGKLQGLIESRDTILAQASQNLNILANSLAFEFNRVQSTGQGLKRFQDLTSLQSVTDPSAVIAQEGKTTALSTLDTLTDSSLIGTADPTGRSLQILTGGNTLETRQITGFDPTTGTLFLDRPLPKALAIGDTYQIKDLPFPVVNGNFDVVVTNETTGIQSTQTVNVNLDRIGSDTTWNDVVSQLNSIPNLSATLTSDNHIRIQSTVGDVTFSFANDTSGFLAAAGLNAMFSGSTAGDIKVNPALQQTPELLSGAQSNTPGDNSNALAFTALQNLTAINGTSTFDDFYRGIVGDIGVQASSAKDNLTTQTAQSQQLENQRQQISGVNIDEEAVNMIEFQRSFQASARFISVIDGLLNSLVSSV
jgi:flagellar hook-associated protein 1 FlgK